jgi:hypothetical protein
MATRARNQGNPRKRSPTRVEELERDDLFGAATEIGNNQDMGAGVQRGQGYRGEVDEDDMDLKGARPGKR